MEGIFRHALRPSAGYSLFYPKPETPMRYALSVAFFFLLIGTLPLRAQSTVADQTVWVDEALRQSRSQHSLAPLDTLLASGKLSSPISRSYAYQQRGRLEADFYEGYIRKQRSPQLEANPLFKQIVANFDSAIYICPPCSIVAKKDRYEALSEIAPRSPLRSIHLEELKSAGYRPKREGMGIQALYWQGHHAWLGGSLSLLSMREGGYWLRYTSPVTGKATSDTDMPLSMQAFTLSYARNLSQPLNDLSFRLLQVNGPVLINLTTFGAQWGQNAEGQSVGRGGYWRPEAGIGMRQWTASYAYNLMFRKSSRATSERHLFHLRYTAVLPYIRNYR